MALTRRHFLKATAATGAGAVLFSGCAAPEVELLVQSPVYMPEDLVTGLDTWYASLCRQCPAGCGIVTRLIEGRATKIEGNPDHPVNRGKLCARGQAGLQALYHPDRIQTPLRRKGERGSGQFEQITWDQALNDLTAQLKGLRERRTTDTMLLATEPIRGHKAMVVDRFISAYGGLHLGYEPMERLSLRIAMIRLFGQDLLPEFDLENTQFLLSFGADFLETWLSPVRYNRGYGELRQGRPGRRGTFVQIEPRMSMTASNADKWVPIKPGTEGVLALSLAQVIVSEGLGQAPVARAMTAGQGAAALEAFRPESASQITGVAAVRIAELAREFARNRPSLAIAGGSAGAHTNGLFNISAVLALNFLVDSVGKPGGLLLNPPPPLDDIPAVASVASFAEWQRVIERMATGQPRPVNLLLLHNANLLHGLPASLKATEAIRRVPFIVSFSSFMDDTTAHADLILPDHAYLEDWGDDVPDPGPGYQVLTFQQPVVNQLLESRGFVDILLSVAGEMGADVGRALPWNTYKDLLREGAQKLFALNRGSVRAASFEAFWIGLLQRGGWWDTQARFTGDAPRPPVLPRQAAMPSFAGSEQQYPFNLMVFPSLSLTDGRGAHLPWLQSTPDPLTTVMWQTWVEVNPETAGRLGVKEGDVVAVESPNGMLEAPVYVHPAIPPDVVAIPAGQGHASTGRQPDSKSSAPLPFLHPGIPPDALGWSVATAGVVYGRYAEGRGANVFSILAPLTDQETGTLAWAATRVSLSKTGRAMRLPKLEGSVPAVQPPDVEAVQVTPA